MTPQRIAILRKQLAQLEAERADRVRRGASVPVWFDHMLDKRRTQLREASTPPAPARAHRPIWPLAVATLAALIAVLGVLAGWIQP